MTVKARLLSRASLGTIRISDPVRRDSHRPYLPARRAGAFVEILDLLARAQRAELPRALAARVAQSRAQAALRRRHRRRRRARARDRLLPREEARHHQRRGAREGLARRRQHRAQHDDRPLELPPRPQRAFLRVLAQAVGEARAGPQLQRDVQRARRAEPRAFAGGDGRGDAPRQRDAAQRHRREVHVARRDRALDPEPRLLAGRALPDPRRPPAAARRHGAPRRGRLGLRARRRRAAASTSSSNARSPASGSRTARSRASKPRRDPSRRRSSGSPSPAIPATSPRWRA